MEVYFFISVSVHCKDTRIVVNVGTNKPFSGRIYALGRFVAMTSKSILAGKKQELLLNEKNCHNDLSSRSETCNVDVINSDTFRLVVNIVSEFVTAPQLANNRNKNCNYESNHQNNQQVIKFNPIFPRLDLTMGGQDCNTQSAVSLLQSQAPFLFVHFHIEISQ